MDTIWTPTMKELSKISAAICRFFTQNILLDFYLKGVL
jgi:hypothetical protein